MTTGYLTLTVCLFLSMLPGCTQEARKERYLAEGNKSFQAGAYDKARVYYMKVLQLDQRNAIAFARLGQIWLDGGAPLRAGAFLKKAEELAPNDSENRLRLANVYLTMGGSAEAKKEALNVLEQSPANGKALLLLTEMAHTPEAIKEAERAIAKFPARGTTSYHLAIANLAMRPQNMEVAERAIATAAQVEPKSPAVHQAKGTLDLLQKNPKGAVEEFKTAAQLAPLRSNFKMTYAQYLNQAEGAEAATAYLKEITTKAPDYLPGWTLLARIAFAGKKYEQVPAYLENVFSRDPENIDARLLQSDLWLAKHQPDKAITELEKLDKNFSGSPPVKYRLAQAYLQQNKSTQAADALDQALAKNPDYREAILARAELNLRTGHLPPAIRALEELLRKYPGFKPAQLLLADAYRAVGRPNDAAILFQEQIKVTPNAPDPYFFLGLTQLEQNKSDEARKSFEKVLELSPDNVLAVEQLINLDLRAKDFAAASPRVQGQLKQHPDRAASYIFDGRLLMAQFKWNEAERALKKALELDPDSVPAYDMLVTVYQTTNRLPQAAHELESVLSKAPNNQNALMRLAAIREKQKDFPKAREAYEKVLALNPGFVPALNNLSYLFAEQFNQPDKAYELAQKARTLDSRNPAVADTLGWAAFKRGDYPHALTLLEESSGKISDTPEIQFHLGMANYMMGRTDAARSAFQRALATPGDFPSKARAESQLALLGDGANTLSSAQLEEMISQRPNDPTTRVRLAESYEREKEWGKAASAYEGALEINPKMGSAALKLARIYSGPPSNKEKALIYAKMARALAPDDPKTAALLGHVAYECRDYSWSYDLLRESSRQLGSDPQVLHDLSWAAYSLGKVDVAREAMQRSLDASPSPDVAADAKSFLTLTALETNPADLAGAKPVVDARLKADPNDGPALMAAATSDLQAGNKSAAVDRYQQILHKFPDFAPAQKRLASIYAEDPSHIQEAFDLGTKARKSLPHDPELAELLGQLSYQKKDYGRAIQLLQESARSKPLDAISQYYLGLACKEEKRPSDAVKALTEALVDGNLPAARRGSAERARGAAKTAALKR